MIRMTAAVAVAAMIAASAAQAQNAPPPGNVNPGSLESGQEQTGAPNQPRSGNYGAIKGTTGSGISSPDTNPAVDGTNANVKPSSPESGSEPSGAPAGERR
jgi:opacity protein-like surface antigen